MSDGTRLNKFLASCGIGSRRACDALVQEGRVEINGKPCLNPAERVGPEDFVKVDGRRVTAKEAGVIAFHKPRGLVCSRDDEFGRETIYAALPVSLHHFHHVGRLDRESEGLLILTNDGAISQAMIHPSKAIEKEYIVTVNQPVLKEHLDLFLSGVFVENEKLVAKETERLSARRVRIILETGLKRQIRLMFQALGYQVTKLVRIRIGSFGLADLPPGKWRPLDPKETALLMANPKRKPLRKPAAKKAAAKTAKKTAPSSKRSPGTKPSRRLSPGPPGKRIASKKTSKRAPRRKF